MLKKIFRRTKTPQMIKNKNGFTLIEFLLVIAAVGVVAALSLAVLKPVFDKSDTSAAVASINNLKANSMVYASDNMNSFAGISTSAMISQSILGSNWSGETACVPGAALTGVHHCNPWGGSYVISPSAANPTNVFFIALSGVPENNAYAIASEFWNSDDNNPTDTGAPAGTISGTEFIAGTTNIWMSQGNPAAIPTTVGTLNIYFSY